MSKHSCINRCAAAAGVLFIGMALAAGAQQYPTKPVRIIAPFAPGGGTDFIARIAAQKLTEATGQQFIVDNRPGAGGSLGAELGTRAPADGYTLTLIAGSYAVNPSIYKLAFDPVNDITALIQMSQGPLLIAAHPTLPVKTAKDIIAIGKAKPGHLLYATSGQGSIVHLATEYFADMAGIKMTHVPYKGTGPALIDTVAGQTQLIWGSIAPTAPHVKSGKLKAIGVTTANRVDAFPNVPTVNESGLKGYEVILWHGLVGPKNLPRPIVDRINSELNKILKTKDMQEKLAADGVSAAGGTPEQFGTTIKRDIDTWRRVVQKAGVKPGE
jgi:tripartite-type tricarboxylate transporter receptor subunit TctC